MPTAPFRTTLERQPEGAAVFTIRLTAVGIALMWTGLVYGQDDKLDEKGSAAVTAMLWTELSDVTPQSLPPQPVPPVVTAPPQPSSDRQLAADGAWPAGSWPFTSSAAVPRIYISAIVGNAFATLETAGSLEALPGNTFTSSGTVDASILTGGGAIGLAIPRPAGQLRLEFEGRARGSFTGPTRLTQIGPGTDIQFPLQAKLYDGWSATTNFWRDVFLTETVGFYLGGGFGAGGYQYQVQGGDALLPVSGPTAGSATITTFAWQAGTGVVWDVSDQITLDLGYRFFSYGQGSTPLTTDNGLGFGYLGNSLATYSTSELLFTVRIYEPFRRVLR